MPREMYIGGEPSSRVVRRVNDFVGAAATGTTGTMGDWSVLSSLGSVAPTTIGPIAINFTESIHAPVATVSVTNADKVYAEVHIGYSPVASSEIGITNLSAGSATLAGLGGTGGMGYHFATGTLRNDAGASTAATAPTLGSSPAGTVLQLAYDGPAAKLFIGVNNGWGSQDPAAGTSPAFYSFTISGGIYLSARILEQGGNIILPANFTYTAPTGFTNWGA